MKIVLINLKKYEISEIRRAIFKQQFESLLLSKYLSCDKVIQ